METMRAFIAVDIGDEIRAKLDELQRRLKKVHANVRWVNPRNMHLTLVFLGDVPAGQIAAVRQVMNQAAHGQGSFTIAAQGAGFFGKPGYPRVIWVGLGDCPTLMQLQGRIVQGLHHAEIDFDSKRFSPHLTLGRVKGIDQHIGPLLQKVKKFRDTESGSALIDRVELIQSTLTPRGAEYRVLHRVNLN